MFTAVIADDEPLAREKLRGLLAGVPWLECVGEAADGPSTVTAVDTRRPDLLFLDIHMPGMNGLQVLERLQHRPHVAFTTAYSEHAVTAFELRALDYLLKPFGRRRLLDTVERARLALGTASHAVDAGVEALATDRPLAHLFVRTGTRIVPIPVGDVSRFEARDDYVAIHLPTTRHLASIRMHDLEACLDPAVFVRIHRSHIVNLGSVISMTPHESGRLMVRMRDGTTLFASRTRSQALRKRVI